MGERGHVDQGRAAESGSGEGGTRHRLIASSWNGIALD